MYVRMRSLMWVVTFVIVCGAVTTLLQTGATGFPPMAASPNEGFAASED